VLDIGAMATKWQLNVEAATNSVAVAAPWGGVVTFHDFGCQPCATCVVGLPARRWVLEGIGERHVRMVAPGLMWWSCFAGGYSV
jgi:hypothetical protein